jgi:transcriptional regulator with XRE-family HTH domain
MMSNKVGEIIAMHRKLRGLSQTAVARAARRSQVWLSMVELGKIQPGAAQLRKIAAALSIPIKGLGE